MVEREAGSKVSCTSNVRHGTTSHDLVLFSTCVCALLPCWLMMNQLHQESRRNSAFSLTLKESRSAT